MLGMQKKFAENWTNFNKLSYAEKEKAAKEYLLKTYKELSELSDAVHNHSWSEPKSLLIDSQRELILEELVDTFKYLMNIGFCYGMTDMDFYKKFMEKHKKNNIRLEEAKKTMPQAYDKKL